MRIFTILLGLLILPFSLFSKEVSVKEAQNVAKNFFYYSAQKNLSKHYQSLNLTLNHIESDGDNLFYVFNIENQKGFVITSAQDCVQPILGYSDDNDIDFSNLSPELNYMLQGYKKQIKYGLKNHIKAPSRVAEMWQSLRIFSENKTSVTEPVGPLLLTEWNQSPYYNDMCPTNSEGEHAVSGCVAVAMAQVMKYYDYPKQGEGSHYHADYNGDVMESSTINYAEQTYEWSNMPAHLSAPNTELAKLMYHCGQSVDMDWGVEGSGAYTNDVEYALKNYFKYAASVDVLSKDTYYGTQNYTDEEWGNIIRGELDAHRPLIYAGVSSEGGHAWDCDGYQSSDVGYLYHMNYGWGGSGNGYFALDNLISGTLPGGDVSYFDESHRIITGIKPRANNGYPLGCSESRVITGNEGIFGDGSGNEDYQNNSNCETLIQSQCHRGSVTLSFERFDLAEGDIITLYEGEDVNAPVIAQLDATNQPSGSFTSKKGAMLIVFETNDSGTASGWDASYTTKACGNTTLTEPNGEINDGSGVCDYEPGTHCKWYIKSENAEQIVIDFTEFNLDTPNKDYVKIYKDVMSSGTLITTLKGTDLPNAITVDSDVACIRFYSYGNEDNVGTGWTLNYYSSGTSIDNEPVDLEKLVKVYPNPFRGNAIINVQNPSNQVVKFTLNNIMGQTIAQHQYTQPKEVITIELSDIYKNELQTGVYILNVSVGNQKASYRLIAE